MSIPAWQNAVTDSKEISVFHALENPDWDWRTLDGLKKATGLDASEILTIAYKYPQYIRSGQSNSKGTVFQLKDRAPSGNSFKENAIDWLTFSRSRKLK